MTQVLYKHTLHINFLIYCSWPIIRKLNNVAYCFGAIDRLLVQAVNGR